MDHIHIKIKSREMDRIRTSRQVDFWSTLAAARPWSTMADHAGLIMLDHMHIKIKGRETDHIQTSMQDRGK